MGLLDENGNLKKVAGNSRTSGKAATSSRTGGKSAKGPKGVTDRLSELAKELNKATDLGVGKQAKKIVGKTVVSPVVQALEAIDTPRRVIVAGAEELLEGDGISGKDFLAHVKDKNYGVGDIVAEKGGTGNKWADRALGFAGDVLLDPTTYLSLGTTVAAKGGGKALQMGLKEGARRLAKESGEEAADKALRRGYLKPEELSRIGAKGGVQFGAGSKKVMLPGTDKTADAILKALKPLTQGIKNTKVGTGVRTAIAPEALRPAIKAAKEEGGAIKALKLEDAYRATKAQAKGVKQTALRELNQIYKEHRKDDVNAIRNAMEGVAPPTPAASKLRDWSNRVADAAQVATGRTIPRIEDWLGHRMTPELRDEIAAARGKSPRVGAPGSVKRRKFVAGETWMGETLETGTIDEINKITRAKTGKEIDAFISDPWEIAKAYANDMERYVNIHGFQKNLVDGGLLVRSSDLPMKTVADEAVPKGAVPPEAAAVPEQAVVPEQAADTWFHGTPHNFENFAAEPPERTDKALDSLLGTFFTNSREEAERYARGARVQGGGPGRVIEQPLSGNFKSFDSGFKLHDEMFTSALKSGVISRDEAINLMRRADPNVYAGYQEALRDLAEWDDDLIRQLGMDRFKNDPDLLIGERLSTAFFGQPDAFPPELRQRIASAFRDELKAAGYAGVEFTDRRGVLSRGVFDAPGSELARASDAGAGEPLNINESLRLNKLVSKSGRELGPDDDVILYHGTDAATAEALIHGGAVPGSKKQRPATVITEPVVAKMLGKNVGDTVDYEPGRGQGSGLYLAATKSEARTFGNTVIPVRVKVGDLSVPPERAGLTGRHGDEAAIRSLLVGDGYVEKALGPEAFTPAGTKPVPEFRDDLPPEVTTKLAAADRHLAEGNEPLAKIATIEAGADAAPSTMSVERLYAGVADPKRARDIDAIRNMGLREMADGKWSEPWVAEAMVKFSEALAPDNPNGFLKTFDWVTSRWKAYSLLSPGFHARNWMGGVFNNSLAGVNRSSYSTFSRWHGRYRKGGLDAIKDPKVREAFAEMERLGVLGGGNVRDLSDISKGSRNGLLPDRVKKIDPTSLEFKPLTLNRRAGERVEDNLRGVLFLDQFLKGASPQQALETVVKFHFDYDDLTRFEDKVLRRVIPFYTWTRKNFPLQVEQMMRQPGKYTRYLHARNNIELYSEEEDIVPSYIHSLLPIRGGKTAGGQVYWTPDLPFRDLTETFDIQKVISMTNPLLKTPVEAQSGHKFYENRELGQYLVEAPAVWNPLLTALQPVRGKFGMPKFEKNTDGKWMITEKESYKIEQMLPLLSRMRRLAPSEEKYQDRAITSWLSFAFGISGITNTEQAQAGEVKRITEAVKKVNAQARQLQGGEAATSRTGGGSTTGRSNRV